MTLSCLFGRHSALPSDVRNLGLRVSQCSCCGRDMIHARGRWTQVPRGFRIVWRRLDEVVAEAVPLKLTRNLPVLSRNAHRHFMRDLARRAADMIELVGSGLKVTGWAIADRCRTLRASLIEPFEPRQLVLPIFATRH
jgi:hypothetical protein